MGKSVEKTDAKSENKLPILKRTLFFSIFSLAIVFLFFFVELIFQLSGLGISTEPFIEIPGKPGWYRDNPDEYLKKYFPKSESSKLDIFPNFFKKLKDPNVIRGISIGESSSQGIPYAVNEAFPKIAETAITSVIGGKKIEILNISGSAMSSFYLKDISKKLKKFDPDFVIIYAGHNEYYGTISASTGSSTLLQDLNLFLKESRIFQVVSNLFVGGQNDEKSLMERQFSDKEFALEFERDKIVADTFLKNLQESVDYFTSQKIQVFLFEPVSNLISFPPFRSQSQAEISEKIKALVPNGNVKDFPQMNLSNLRNLKNEYPRTALVHWLNGLLDLKGGSEDLSSFYLAKDLDSIPFRARSTLVEKLKSWAVKISANNPYLTFIPTTQRIVDRLGPAAFSNLIFIDQLHFNHFGHTFIANLLSEEILKKYYPQIGIEQLKSFFGNPTKAKVLLSYTDYDEMKAFVRMTNLLNSLPYSKMPIPYVLDKQLLLSENNIFDKNEIYKQFAYSASRYASPLEVLVPDFIKSKDYSSWEFYLNSDLFKYPGSYFPHLELGNFLAAFPQTRETAINHWKLSLELTTPPYNEKVFAEIKNNMMAAGFPERIRALGP